jgi:pimeloyl-ACP methyl ester carboxylesterase
VARLHILEAGFDVPNRPCVLLLHGFPELAWSWRRVVGPLSQAGFHVVAPDLRRWPLETSSQPLEDDSRPKLDLYNRAAIPTMVFATAHVRQEGQHHEDAHGRVQRERYLRVGEVGI